ncbi:MAG: hypothetical protein K6T75_08175 [Acetobacteraceae bacterium]|nr:hypothetical protein [Acetobacteraceae bacterium]
MTGAALALRVIRVLAGVPGQAGFGGDGGPASDALLYGPTGVTVDEAGNVYIADAHNQRVRRVDARTGRIATVAGNGEEGFGGDGGPALSAALFFPLGVAVDADGNLYIADSQNHRLRRVDGRTGVITTFAGGKRGYGGDGGPATSARLALPSGVLVARDGRILTNDFMNNRIRAIDTQGIITTLVSGETPGGMEGPHGIGLDPQGRLHMTDYRNQRVLRFDPEAGRVVTFAGGNGRGFGGDGGPATMAQFNNVHGVAFDPRGDAYIADYGNRRVRRVDAETGLITTAVGSGERGPSGAGGPPVQAALGLPSGVAVDAGRRRLYIPDYEAHCVWMVE